MIEPAVALSFFLLWLAIIPTPGANTLLIVHLALSSGRAHVASAIAGNVAGFVVLGSGALFGWNAAIEALPVLKPAIRIGGAAYLIWFGWQLWRAGAAVPAACPQTLTDQATDDVGLVRRQLRHAFGLGLMISLSNAQAIVFITSLFAVAGVYDARLATGIACIGIMVASNATYLAALASVLQIRGARAWYARRQALMKQVVGVLFTVIGGNLLVRAIIEAVRDTTASDVAAIR